MKTLRPNFVLMLVVLCVVGYLVGPYLPKLRGFVFEPYSLHTLSESIISFVFLGVLCSIGAGIILWAYSKTQLPHRPRLVFGSALVVSAVSSFVSIWFGFQQAHFFLSLAKDQVPDIPLSRGYANYLAGGFETLFLTCAVMSISLLWLARWQKTKATPAIPSNTNKMRDITLIISTLVIYAFSIKNMLEFIFSTLVIWRLSSIR